MHSVGRWTPELGAGSIELGRGAKVLVAASCVSAPDKRSARVARQSPIPVPDIASQPRRTRH
eukprot:1284697-Rhodomonas_salina.1